MLNLLTVLALGSRDVVSSVDLDGSRDVFMGCLCGVYVPFDGYHTDSHDDVDEDGDDDYYNTYRSR